MLDFGLPSLKEMIAGVTLLVALAFFGGVGFYAFFYSSDCGCEPVVSFDYNSLEADFNSLALNQLAIFSQLSFSSCSQAVDVNGSVLFVPLVSAQFEETDLDLGGGFKREVRVFNNIVCPVVGGGSG